MSGAAISTHAPPDDNAITIAPPQGVSLRLKEIWDYRELTWFLVLRSIKPRYRQTALGLAWAVIPPFFLMVVFSVFFNRVANVPSAHGIPYPIFSYTGLIAWAYFSNAVTRGASSLISNSAFLSKVYFPRVLIPLSTVLAALFDMVFAFIVLVPLMFYYGFAPNSHLVALPLFVLLAVTFSTALSLWLTAASVRFRDLTLAIPLVVQVGLYVTPVIYPVTIFGEPWRTVIQVANPMATVVDGFRWSLLGRGSIAIWPAAGATCLTFAILVGGLLFFNRLERTYADDI